MAGFGFAEHAPGPGFPFSFQLELSGYQRPVGASSENCSLLYLVSRIVQLQVN
jgi:hypothetical protein